MKTILRVGLFLVFLNASSIQSELLLGLHANGDHLAYAYKKTIYIRSISKDSIEKEVVLVKDTQLWILIYAKLLQTKQALKADESGLKLAIADFTIVNLTYHYHHLFVGIRFFKSLKGDSKAFYGLVELDENLKRVNYFVFNGLKEINLTLLPYFPLEFLDSQYIVLPTMDSGKMIIRKYKLVKESHEVEAREIVRKDIQFAPLNQVKLPEGIVLDPMLYPVSGSAYEYYFQYPFPVIIQSKQKYLDVRGDFKKLKKERNPGLSSGLFLTFDQQVKIDSGVMLATYKSNNDIYYLYAEMVSKKAFLIHAFIKEFNYSPVSFNIPYNNSYFTFHRNQLLALRFKEGNLILEKIELN